MPDAKSTELEPRQKAAGPEADVRDKPGTADIEVGQEIQGSGAGAHSQQSTSEIGSRRSPSESEIERPIAPPLAPIESDIRPRRRGRIRQLLTTLATVAIAVLLGRAMWNTYMGAPWTRDGTVRAYVVTMAPEVAGRIVELPVADNQFVHKGDLLVVIDPTNFKIAVSLSEAAVQQAQANAQK